ncbi:ankyrin repeat domain-containing protein 13C-B-like [Halichondria panicea]|uniref:ankyrin repeat domain-containing protein 13C-B-like n=1 Tax=Halichondria panicea TaxID=6063 RepID=UPI00312BBFF3
MASNGSTEVDQNSSTEDHSFDLHRAAFHGDVDEVREVLETVKLDDLKSQDKHGNTALHIAVMLGYKAVIEELVKHGSPVKEKNNLGWTPLDEAISYGDRDTIILLIKTLRGQIAAGIVERRQELIRSLVALEDFHINLRWEFHTWVPFLSRMLPSDVCRIYKKGASIRVDSSIGNFQEMKWSRGDKSFIFNGEDTNSSLTMVILDNEKKEFERKKLLRSDDNHGALHERVTDLMSHPIVYANMSTKPITVSRALAGWWFFKGPRSEQVGEYNTDVYDITDLILISRKRRDHLTPEQIKEFEHLQKKLESGRIEEKDFEDDKEDRDLIPSMPPPEKPTITWDQYCHAPTDQDPPHLGRPMDLKVDKKHFKASVWMAEECPIKLQKLLDILEVIVPYKHFHKLRQFVKNKIPEGFPVKLEIPVFPTVTAIVTMEEYKTCDTQDSKFLIPRDYTKFEPKENEDNCKASS